MSYKINFLNKNPIFQEIIDCELDVIKNDYAKRILKLDSVIKKSDIQLTENQGLMIYILTKDDREFNLELSNNYQIILSKDEISVYFPEEKVNSIQIDEDLTSEFLEAKEPLLLEQLKIMALVKDESLWDKIKDLVIENLK